MSSRHLTSNSFLHEFSGFSVWLEPDPDEVSEMVCEMRYLADTCGGNECGLHPFIPHCSLLYNTHLPGSTEGNGADDFEGDGEKLLQKCLEKLKSCNDDSCIELIPMDHFYFRYPKSADDGRGFGCVISLIKFEVTPELRNVHRVVREIFPPDERHGDANGDFIPHLSLVYAPESMNKWVEDHTMQMEAEKRHTRKTYRAKYLSLVCTRGTIADWYEVAKVMV